MTIDFENRYLQNQTRHLGGFDLQVPLGNLTFSHPPGDDAPGNRH